ncbi:glutaredoxin [uncultured Parolsenella sp.]|uniref:glutaredoxin family protein n=1 Tax=uncultured Parolsenella sp. TaxID=2083008 RepID=UPI0025FA293E|nr:glutaredoxin [uncultured Parolsenella sp.]
MNTTHELELFMKPTCPYCIKVMNFMSENNITIPLRDIVADESAAETLVAVGGKRQVPCLFIDGKPLYESGDIIEWLRDNAL